MHTHVAYTKARPKPLNGNAKHGLISRKTISSARHCDNVLRVKHDERSSAFPDNNAGYMLPAQGRCVTPDGNREFSDLNGERKAVKHRQLYKRGEGARMPWPLILNFLDFWNVGAEYRFPLGIFQGERMVLRMKKSLRPRDIFKVTINYLNLKRRIFWKWRETNIFSYLMPQY